ncbi:unnamed protein product [Allacma fusca]|uniref:Uncharacterized protein n=1 Tax=Allacma fusca TaxID=39272 RepID=A0A8J2JZ99_9HEXA|nr:unnamed protein product [Allacma fusca]
MKSYFPQYPPWPEITRQHSYVETRTSIEYEDSDNEDYFDGAVAQDEQTAIRWSQQTASQEWEISEIEVEPQVRKQFTSELESHEFSGSGADKDRRVAPCEAERLGGTFDKCLPEIPSGWAMAF